MSKSKLEELLRKYEEGNCSKRELMLLHRYFDLFQKSDITWDHDEKDQIRREIYTNLQNRIQELPGGKGYPLNLIWRIAATVIIVVGVGISLRNAKQPKKVENIAIITKSTLPGQNLTIKLPDGSRVRLNANSTIKYPESFSASREINLSGEGFFTVERNTLLPFEVITGNITTTVLGTSFNVNAYPDKKNIKVTVASGLVEVGSVKQLVQLNPGEQATYESDDDDLYVRDVDVGQFTSWKDGILVFESSTLPEILEELQNWYGVTIDFEAPRVSACNLRLKFDNLSLKQALDQIKLVTGVNYTFVSDKHVELLGTPCTN
ncbi:MAG: FecR domain-containing protein [Cytophagales bacterium]|nr:FecR domain-containing protein [Cytophagales bacterium]